MPYFEHNGANIYYEIWGEENMQSRFPIMLLHGNGESMEIFKDTVTPLLKRFTFIAVDSRGHGRSEICKDSPTLSYELMASDIDSLIHHLNINQCDIVGFSDGGIVALMLAKDVEGVRQKIRRLIAIGVNVRPDGIKRSAILAMKLIRAKAKALGDNWQHELFNMMLTQPNIKLDELTDIFAQTAIVAGEHDIIKRTHTEDIKNAIMRARLIIIKGANHMIPQNCPGKLREIIMEELE